MLESLLDAIVSEYDLDLFVGSYDDLPDNPRVTVIAATPGGETSFASESTIEKAMIFALLRLAGLLGIEVDDPLVEILI